MSMSCCPRALTRARALPQLDRLALDGDPLGAHLLGLVAVRVADDRGRVARGQRFLGQAAVLHAGRRGKHDEPGLARRLEAHVAVRMLVAGLDDLAGERERLVRVVLAPAMVRGDWRSDRESGERGEDVLHGASPDDYARCGRKVQPTEAGLALRRRRAA